MRSGKTILYLVVIAALIEGFTGLGIEIYAMRLAGSYIGSSISITGIIIGIMLIAIAFGYWWGGRISNKIQKNRKMAAAGWLLGLSAMAQAIIVILQALLLFVLMQFKIDGLISATLLSMNFAIGMVFATASIPVMTQVMVDEVSNEELAGKYTGVLVASTTLGSVLGSILTPIALLPTIGLQATISLMVILLAVASFLVFFGAKASPNAQKKARDNLFMVIMVVWVLLLSGFNYFNKFDTSIQTRVTGWYIFDIGEKTGSGSPQKTIMTDTPNKLFSSCWQRETKTACDAFYPNQFIANIIANRPSTILMFGGAGLSIPSDHRVTDANPNIKITVVDLDGELPAIASREYLKQPLGQHINFVQKDVRSYILANQNKHYDMVMLDVFRGKYVDGVTYTLENLQDIKAMSDKVMANVIGIPQQGNLYTQTIANTWVRAFGDNAHWILDAPNQSRPQGIIFCSFKCANAKQITTSPYFKKSEVINTLDKVVTDGYRQQRSI